VKSLYLFLHIKILTRRRSMRIFLALTLILSSFSISNGDTTIELPLIQDGYMYETGPAGPGGDGSSSELCVGINPDNGNWYSALKFDISGIPTNATITSATLICFYYDYYGKGPYDRWVSLYGAHGNWDESTITWKKPSKYGWYINTNIIGNSTGWYGWASTSFTKLVQDWVEGVHHNYGLILAHAYDTGERDHRLRFYSKTGTHKPKLVVTYTIPMPPPTVTDVDPDYSPETGGIPVTITGTDFTTTADTVVYFGNSAAHNLHVKNSTTIHCDTPVHAAGQVSVKVKNSNGTGACPDLF
jgi:hypothetical protein